MSVDTYFSSLSKRETMLLLTAVTFGGQECVSTFDHLEERSGALLKHRAQLLLQIPREKRIPVLVQEIKRMVAARRGRLWTAEPRKLTEVLAAERPVLRELLLRAFPSALVETVRKGLPPSGPSPRKDIHPEVLQLIAARLEGVLDEAGARRSHFKFSDVVHLQLRELFTLCDSLGARVLGPALGGLATAEREQLLQGAPPDARQWAERGISLAERSGRTLSQEAAGELLAGHRASEIGLAAALRSAGAQRLARASLAQSAEFAAILVGRHRGEFGTVLAGWVRQERQRSVHRGDGGRAELVAELERLEGMGLVDKPVRLQTQGARSERSGDGVSEGRPPARRAPEGATATGGPPRGATGRRPSEGSPVVGAPSLGEGPQLSRRDWVAERNARRAGVGSSTDGTSAGTGYRDPMAARAARKAGAVRDPDPEAGLPTGPVRLPSRQGSPSGRRPRADEEPDEQAPPSGRRPRGSR